MLAQHYERGALPAKALAWCRTAAQEALEGNDFSAALSAASRALGHAEASDAGSRGELLLLEGEARYWQGAHAAAQESGARAVELLPDGSDAWFAAVALCAVAAHRSGDTASEIALAKMLLDDGWVDCPGVATLNTCARVAVALVQIGEFQLADEMFSRFEPWAPGVSKNPAAFARWKVSLAARALYGGQTLAYQRLSQEAAAASEQAGDYRLTAVQRHNAGHASLELGAWEDAERELSLVLTLSERLGLANVYASAKNNLGAVLGRLGRFDEARRLLEDAIGRLVSQKDLRMEGGARNHLAEVHLAAGDVDAAVQSAERAIEVLVAVPPLWAQATGTLARALRARGDTVRALELAHAAHERLEALGAIADGEASVRLVYAEALADAGRLEEAKHVLVLARTRLLSRASEIDDPAVRRVFVERVSENARTLQLAESWGIS